MDIKRLIYSVIACLLLGNIGTIFTVTAIPSWYSALKKAPFNPPNWIFGPVWTLLFIIMGIVLYLIWKNKKAVMFFYIQFALNIFWSVLFFGLKNPFFAFIDIALLWIAILATMITSCKKSRTASYLLIPYLMWVTFAALLNIYVVILN